MNKIRLNASAEDFCFDASKLPLSSMRHLINGVEYALGYSNKPVEELTLEDVKSWRITNYVCFSGFSSKIQDITKFSKKVPNRMYYKLVVYDKSMELLDDIERAKWITLSKMHGLLPACINDKQLQKADDKKCNELIGHFFLDIEEISPSLLYVYLSTLRNLREDPGFPKTVMFLFYEVGMNFFAAYVLGSMIAIQTTGHHILRICRSYGSLPASASQLNKYVHELKVSLPITNSLRRFVHNPAAVDKDIAVVSRYLRASPIIEDINKSKKYARFTVTASELLDRSLVRAIMALSDDQFDKHIYNYIKKITRRAEIARQVCHSAR